MLLKNSVIIKSDIGTFVTILIMHYSIDKFFSFSLLLRIPLSRVVQMILSIFLLSSCLSELLSFHV